VLWGAWFVLCTQISVGLGGNSVSWPFRQKVFVKWFLIESTPWLCILQRMICCWLLEISGVTLVCTNTVSSWGCVISNGRMINEFTRCYRKVPGLGEKRNAGLMYSILAAISFKIVSLGTHTAIPSFFPRFKSTVDVILLNAVKYCLQSPLDVRHFQNIAPCVLFSIWETKWNRRGLSPASREDRER
jgi:hypothetical protein